MTNEIKTPGRIYLLEEEIDEFRDTYPVDGSICFMLYDLHRSLVAAAYEDAAKEAQETCKHPNVSSQPTVFVSRILARTPSDAQAALEARDQQIREKAMGEAIAAAERVSRRGKHGCEGAPWAGWSEAEYKKYKWAALDVKHEIEKLIEKEQTDE